MLDLASLATLAAACAPLVAADTALAIVRTESSGNPYAIGVVGNALTRQPKSPAEAVATARHLERTGWDYSAGLGQINRRNFSRLGLTTESVFDPCTNLKALQVILGDCFARAPARQDPGIKRGQQVALRQAFSCYYSGNFRTGFRADLPQQPPYVDRVLASWARNGGVRGGAPPPD